MTDTTEETGKILKFKPQLRSVPRAERPGEWVDILKDMFNNFDAKDYPSDHNNNVVQFKPSEPKSDNPFRSFVGDNHYLTDILSALDITANKLDGMLNIDGSLTVTGTRKDKMKNPLQASEYPTPKNVNELNDYISEFSGADKAIALTVMGMTWNLAAKIVEERLNKEDE
jgi:hypothetical protein